MLRRLLPLATVPFLIAASPLLPMPAPPTLPPPASGAPAAVPLPPPTSIAPAPAPSGGISPLLTQPGPIYPALPSSATAAPPAAPDAINQQRLQVYRRNLQAQQRLLEDQGVSPSDPRLRDIQQRLNEPGQ